MIATQNNAIRTNYVKAKLDNMQNTIRLCGNKTETVIPIISKSAQKEYKSRYDWVGKVSHWEWAKRLKCAHLDKWYIIP